MMAYEHMPATVYVMKILRGFPGYLNSGQRLTLLAFGNAADMALTSRNGYSGHTAKAMATITGQAESTVRSHITALVKRGILDPSYATGRYRIPEVAFNRQEASA